MKEMSPVYNYTIEQEGEFTKLNYKKTPVSYKMAGPLCWYTFIPAIIITMWFHPESLVSGLLIWLIVMGGLSAGIVAIINILRKDGEIKISDKAVVADHKTYQLDHVSSFLIKDPAGMYSNNTTVIINANNPFSMAGNVANLGQGMGNMANESRCSVLLSH